jgi:ankyrin repeat protein
MVDAKADVNHQANIGYTGLLMACQEGHVERVRLLGDSRADVQLRNNNGETGFGVAAFKGHLKLMIDAKVDINH